MPTAYDFGPQTEEERQRRLAVLARPMTAKEKCQVAALFLGIPILFYGGIGIYFLITEVLL